LTPQGRRALAAFIDGRLPAGQLYDQLLQARDSDSGAYLAPAAGHSGAEREASMTAA
jgi:hypothetical protein